MQDPTIFLVSWTSICKIIALWKITGGIPSAICTSQVEERERERERETVREGRWEGRRKWEGGGGREREEDDYFSFKGTF